MTKGSLPIWSVSLPSHATPDLSCSSRQSGTSERLETILGNLTTDDSLITSYTSFDKQVNTNMIVNESCLILYNDSNQFLSWMCADYYLAELSQCDARARHITCNTPTLSSSFILALKWKLLTPIVTMIKGLRLFCLQFLKLSIIYRVFNVPLTLIIMGDAPCLAPTTLPRSWCQWVSHILYFIVERTETH